MTAALLANSSAFLVSFYKPVLLFLTFLPWLWLVSAKLDKDARFYRLNQQLYNGIYMSSALAALAAMLLVPIFWIGWPLGILILFAPIYAYLQIRNREVPESARFVLTGESLSAKFSRARRERALKAASLQFKDPQGKLRTAAPRNEPGFAVHMQAEDVILPALAARATQLDLAVGSSGNIVAQTIDGVRYKRESLPAESALPLLDYLKDLGCLDVEDRRRRQAAEVVMSGPSGNTKLTMITAGSSAGQELRLIFDRAKQLDKPIDGLGLLPSQLETLRVLEQTEERNGLVLVGAPAGHGLSTSVYSLVGRHDAYTSNIKTLEHEILTELAGVDQVRWDPDNPDVDYATNLQSILRRDPDVVMISEAIDVETARAVAESGLNGPLLYVPQRAAAVTEQIQQWAKIVGDVKVAMSGLRAVINQRLLRLVCPNCRQAFQPTAEQLQKLGLPQDKVGQLHQASGKIQVKSKIELCPVCAGSGYLGQTGVLGGPAQGRGRGDDHRGGGPRPDPGPQGQGPAAGEPRRRHLASTVAPAGRGTTNQSPSPCISSSSTFCAS
ncbi:MAG: ATPase, T2SS/T4P/T4SS family [Planctomycetota bacterium]|jgi:type II secretory ATPase GspE/PulE/Tfp pilus assembly ATPase PilB-like protein